MSAYLTLPGGATQALIITSSEALREEKHVALRMQARTDRQEGAGGRQREGGREGGRRRSLYPKVTAV